MFLVISITSSNISATKCKVLQAHMLSNEKRTEQLSGQSSEIIEFQTAFGATAGLVVKNVLSSASNGPYPLVKPFFKPAHGQFHSLEIYRLFVRGPDRFEVAVLQILKQPVSETNESEAKQRLTNLADEVVKSLQTCTAAFPPRILNSRIPLRFSG